MNSCLLKPREESFSKEEGSAAPFASIPLHLANVTTQQEKSNEKVFVFKENAVVECAIYLRAPTRLMGNEDRNQTAKLSWVTISQTEIIMENINFKGLIQVTARGRIIAKNCSFIPNNTASECAVEIFAQSSGVFENCLFTDSQKAALLVRDKSQVKLINCRFEKNSYSSLLLLDSSEADIDNCDFTDAQRFSVYVYRKSMAIFKNCTFHDLEKGKAVFILFSGKTQFSGCKFKKCLGGAISMAESSTANVDNCQFENINLSAVHGMKNCEFNVTNSSFNTCFSNGVNFEHSTGSVSNCTFQDFHFPVFAIFGPTATPKISNCTINKTESFGAVARDLSAPTFSNITFKDGDTHCFSISDFSNAEIRECTIEGYKGAAFNVFNGAKAHIEMNTISGCKYLSDTFTSGEAIFKNNVFIDQMPLRKRYLGQLTFETNMMNGHSLIIQEIKPTSENETEGQTDSGSEEHSHPNDSHEHIYKYEEDTNTNLTIEELKRMEFYTPTTLDISKLTNQPDFVNLNSPPIVCMGCGICTAEVVCSPCGHRVLCKHCATLHKTCPLCSTLIQKTVNVYKSDHCLICFGSPDTIILPCGHLNICYECALNTWKEYRKCPECREKMGSFRHVFPMVESE